MAYIDRLLKEKGHCVICVAEGAGQDILSDGAEGRDASGNPILKVGLLVYYYYYIGGWF